MKKIIALALVLLSLTVLAVSCGNAAPVGSDGSSAVSTQSTKAPDVTVKNTVTAEITVKDYGVITVELDAKTAPITVANFVKLAKSGFYDGLTFHRIISGFMIQGGDPLGNGTGGSDERIKGEFSQNGVKNNIDHKRGVISMARGGSYYENYLYSGYSMSDFPEGIQNDIKSGFNSASSQFFIVHEDSPHLNDKYAAFGHVTSGMEIVDAICRDAKPIDDNGTIPSDAQPTITSIRITKE